MRVLLTSAGLETETMKEYFISMVEKDMTLVKALFIPTAAIDAEAIMMLPKCINDLLKCGIQNKNIKVYDLHTNMELDKLLQYDVVYLCGGNAEYLLERINTTGFKTVLREYIQADGTVIGVSAGSLIFSNHLSRNLRLFHTKIEVHCIEGERIGKIRYPVKGELRLTNTRALVVRSIPDGMEIIGE